MTGKPGADLELFRTALDEGRVLMAPAALSEPLSSTEMTPEAERALSEMPFAVPTPDFWKETGKLRRLLAKQVANATLADRLVAQSCLEQHLPLLTRDQGIRKWAAKAGLRLIRSGSDARVAGTYSFTSPYSARSGSGGGPKISQ